MRNKSRLHAMIMLAAAMSASNNPTTSFPESPEPYQRPQFHEEEGIKRLIKDYNLIKSGKSKKGKSKQARIVTRIEQWLASGKLTQAHLHDTV